jgi:signal transduction histidine kinase
MSVTTTELQLKETCALTGARWAAWLAQDALDWQVCAAYDLPRELLAYIHSGVVRDWLAGALTSGRGRQRAITHEGLNCRKLYIFPAPGQNMVLAVGVEDALAHEMQRFWRVLSLGGARPRPALGDAVEMRVRNLNLLHEAARQITGLTDMAEASQVLVEQICEHFSAQLAAVLVEVDGELHIRAVSGAGADEWFERWTPLSYAAFQASGQTDLQLCIPLLNGGQAQGVLGVSSSPEAPFSSDDSLVFEALAGILSGVFSGASQYDKLQDAIMELQETQVELQARISAQRDAETRLVQAAKLAAVGEMSAGVAHELNNPLTTVVGFTELVMDDLPDDSLFRKDLEMVLQEARRARSVVRRLLDFSRQSERVMVRASLNEVIEDAFALTNHLLHMGGVQVNISLENSLAWVVMDRNQMKQVLLNLLHNALHAMPEGGHLLVASKRQERYGKYWATVAVRDTGVGIAPEAMERIFEPFFTTRSGKGGTGLGLSVTFGIVTDHGGMIEVESTVQVGSCFTVWLPFAEDEE